MAEAKLPVPTLQETLEKYLEYAAVIASPQQLETTRILVRSFGAPGGFGPKLQEMLEARRKLMDNWVTDWWLDDMYLKPRQPLPINSNPGLKFPRRNFVNTEEVADLGAKFIDSLMDFKEMLDRGELHQELAASRVKGQPLCMEQFYNLLGACRVPGQNKDTLDLPQYDRENPVDLKEEFVIVACRNYFYPIAVKAKDCGRMSVGEIQAQLVQVLEVAAIAPPALKVGLLTAMDRDQWAEARQQLIKDDNNRSNLELISRALCLLCLDEAGGDRPDLDADTNALLRAMHGAGTRYHSANRWFDKTVQVIISTDGTVGMCYEHSAAEGLTVIHLVERMLARADAAPTNATIHAGMLAPLPAPQPMNWYLTANLEKTIWLAGVSLDRQISNLDFKLFTFRGYGREYIKSCHTSPDVYLQLALQLAYYKMYGHLVSTYETATVRRFRKGRVDSIRSAHASTLAWVAAMCTAETSSSKDGKEQMKLELFEEAVNKQTIVMEATLLGHGIDNHLLGLREAARESIGQLPDLFTDPVYHKMMEFKLSTSQSPATATSFEGIVTGFGPVVTDGYGCNYKPKKDFITFGISSLRSSSITNTEAFRQSLEEALNSMKRMLEYERLEISLSSIC